MLYYVPIEPLNERYTEQWYRNFTNEFKKHFKVEVIDGDPLIDYIKVGAFLDINSTIAYKNSQMIKIAKLFHQGKIKDGDIFFFGDTEFWGIESLRLMADMNKIKIKIFSFLHAASYTIEDAFSIAEPYQKYTELGWILSQDKIFVGSEYHKQAFLERRAKIASKEDFKKIEEKIVVTGNPIFLDEYEKFEVKKKNQIVICNRFDYEKRPNISLDICQIIKDKHPDWEIVLTTSSKNLKSNKKWLLEYAKLLEKNGIISIKENLSKSEFHKILAESKVMLSNSIEENFGYCIVESMVYKTKPLAKKDLSHIEILENDDRLLFTDIDEIIEKIEYLMTNDFEVNYHLKYKNVINKIIDEMKE